MKIKDLPKDERPRERLVRFGLSALSDAELLALILRTGTKKENVLDLCKHLLRYNLKELSQLSLNELTKIEGIKTTKASQILACFELGRRVASYNEEQKPSINNIEDAVKILIPHLSSLKKEHVKCLCLDSKNKLLKIETVSVGGLSASIVRPSEVFRVAITESASAIILFHNHPSGDAMPSKEDIELTRRIANAGKLLGIELLDHIIIGGKNYISLKEEGVI